MKTKLMAATIVVLLYHQPLHAQPNNDAVARVTGNLTPAIVVKGATPPRRTLAERMAAQNVPGVSIAVVEDGKIVWAKGFGVKETGTKDAVDVETIFQAASISKPISATAMLRLVEQGKLALDAPVNDYLKSWKLPDNDFTETEKVTLRRLVTHSAGLNVHGFPGYAIGAPLPTVPQLLDGLPPTNTKAVRVENTPGAAWKYSGGGTTIIQLAMTDVTGEAFPALMKRLVLDPVGMRNSAFEQPLSAAKQKLAAAAHKSNGKLVPGRWHVYPELAAAGMWTTPTDLMNWAMHIAAARDGNAASVLSQKMAREMLTVQKEPSGLGPMVLGKGEAMRFMHGGGNEGYVCQVVYFPELKRGAAIMTNSDAGSSVVTDLLNALAKEYRWPGYGPREIEPIKLDAVMLEQLLGEYPSPPALTGGKPTSLFLTHEGGKLMVEVPGFVPKTEIVVLADGELIAPETGFQSMLMKDKDGKIVGVDIGSAKLTKKTK
jgi:CubicO group peptidase (beta-lactamase class C family)